MSNAIFYFSPKKFIYSKTHNCEIKNFVLKKNSEV